MRWLQEPAFPTATESQATRRQIGYYTLTGALLESSGRRHAGEATAESSADAEDGE